MPPDSWAFGGEIIKQNSAQLELIFGLVEGGCQLTLYFFFIFYLVRLWLVFIPKFSVLNCLDVPKKFVWVGGWVLVGGWLRVNLVIAFGLALAQPWLSRTITKKIIKNAISNQDLLKC
jgi:hypothetical protein